MQFAIDPELEAKLQRKVNGGEYSSADAALNEALRRFLDTEQDADDPYPMDTMRHMMTVSAEQQDRGEYTPLDMEALIAGGREILEARQAAKG